MTKEYRRLIDARNYAVNNNQVWCFPLSLFDRLRPFSYFGFPLSIACFVPEKSNRKCRSRIPLLALGFDECTYHSGDVATLRNKTTTDKAVHVFLESDGYIYDTSSGFKFTRDAYMDIEQPNITDSFTKEELLFHPEVQSTLAKSCEDNLWNAVSSDLVYEYERVLQNPECRPTEHHQRFLLKELDLYKKGINFDKLQGEHEEGMNTPMGEDFIRLEYFKPQILDPESEKKKQVKITAFLEYIKQNPTKNFYEKDLQV